VSRQLVDVWPMRVIIPKTPRKIAVTQASPSMEVRQGLAVFQAIEDVVVNGSYRSLRR